MVALLGLNNLKNDYRLEFYAKGGQVIAKLFQKDDKLGTLSLDGLSNQPVVNYGTLPDSARCKINTFLKIHDLSIDPERVSLQTPKASGSPLENLSTLVSIPTLNERSCATSSVFSPIRLSKESPSLISQPSLEQLMTILVQYEVSEKEIETITREASPAELQALLIDALFQQILLSEKVFYPDKSLLYLRGSIGFNLLMASTILKDEQKFQEIFPFYRRTSELFAEDSQGRSALHLATSSGHALAVHALIKMGLKIDKRDNAGLTPLHWAIRKRQIETACILLMHGASLADPLVLEGASYYPIEMVIVAGDFDFLLLFLEKDHSSQINLTRCIPGFGNLLHLTIRMNQSPMLEHLLSFYSSPLQPLLNQRDPQGRTPLQLAAYLGDLNAIRQLHARGVDLDYGNGEEGGTAFHHAALGQQPEAIRLLSWLGASLINCQDNKMRPPMHFLQNKESSCAKECKALLNELPRMARIDRIEPPSFIKRPFFNLVIQGGSSKGIAYLGAIQTMEKLLPLSMLTRIAGTSSGAMIAALLAVGWNSGRLGKFLEQDLGELLDSDDAFKSGLPKAAQAVSYQDAVRHALQDYWDGFSTALHPVTKVHTLQKALQSLPGFASGEKLRLWIESIVEMETGIPYCTFKELENLADQNPQKYKKLYAYSLWQTDKNPVPQLARFSHEEAQWEGLIISDAVRACASIPGILQPHTLHFKDASGLRYPRVDLGKFTDCGLLCNFPIDAFDGGIYQEDRDFRSAKTNRRTLGLRLFDAIPKKEERIRDLSSPSKLVKELISTYYRAGQTLLDQTDFYQDRTLAIPVQGLEQLDFSLSKEAQEYLIACATKATERFFGISSSRISSELMQKEKSISLYPKDRSTFISRTKIQSQTELNKAQQSGLIAKHQVEHSYNFGIETSMDKDKAKQLYNLALTKLEKIQDGAQKSSHQGSLILHEKTAEDQNANARMRTQLLLETERAVARLIVKKQSSFPQQENVKSINSCEDQVLASSQNVQKACPLLKTFNLPFLNQPFIGREKEIVDLHTLFTKNHRVVISGAVGVGKTTLCIKYAREYQKEYDSIYFFSATSPMKIMEGFSKLADYLDIPQVNPLERIGLLKERLDDCQENYLIIFDGADSVDALETLKTYLPEKRNCFLLSTREEKEAMRLNFTSLSLPPLKIDNAANYLIQAFSVGQEAHNHLISSKRTSTENFFLNSISKNSFLQLLPKEEKLSSLLINIAAPNPHFTGREYELHRLHDLCTTEHRVAICGLGGVGKTALSIQYAHTYQNQYKFIYRMSATTPMEITEGFSKLADYLVIPSAEILERFHMLREKLDHYLENYLLIIDGADFPSAFELLRTYLPKKGTCILTTRAHVQTDCLNSKVFELRPFGRSEAVNYLMRTSNQCSETLAKCNREPAATLAERLGYHPLALCQAAAYIRTQGMSFERYIALFENYRMKLFTAETLHVKTGETLFDNLQISLDVIEKSHGCSLATEVLFFFSFLGQTPIHFSLAKSWLEAAHPELGELALMEALHYLQEYSLIYTPKSELFSIHLLVQEAARFMLSSKSPEACTNVLSQVIKGTSSFFKEHDLKNLGTRKNFKEWAPHIEAILKHEEQLLTNELKHNLFSEIIALANQLSGIYYSEHMFKEAERLAIKSLQFKMKYLTSKTSEIVAGDYCPANTLSKLDQL